MSELLVTGPQRGPILVLAHGAGAPMDSKWMERMSDLLTDVGVRTIRFEFAYMAARRRGVRRPPPRADTLLGEYRAVVSRVAEEGGVIAIGGKSMGGRVASMIADEELAAGRVNALVCLGYPFHPPGHPDRPRTAHLAELRTPALFVQGTRDPFGTPADVAEYALDRQIRIAWLEDGTHELAPRPKVSGLTHEQHLTTAAELIRTFLDSARASSGLG